MSSKRVDVCAAQFANLFQLADHAPIEGKVCLELGSGWVLSHALVCYLLGAKKVIATDIAPCAFPEALSHAVKHAIAYLPRDLLASFSDHARIRARMDHLLSIPTFNFQVLNDLGIEYRSPIDLAVERIGTAVDFIYSFSVLEHVPRDDVTPLLRNLVDMLSPGGTMIHSIHMEDHQDFKSHPFAFLGIGDDAFPRKLQSDRGNRIRSSEWKAKFAALEGVQTDVIYEYSREDAPMPERIDSTITFTDAADLRVSHLGMYTRKSAAAGPHQVS